MKRGYFPLALGLLLSHSTISLAQNTDSIPTYQIATVEVTGQKIPSTTKSSSPLQVVTSADIYRTGILSVSDAVRRFSGVTVKDYGGAGGMKTVSIRGMGAQHTAVNYDGVTVSDIQSGQIDIGRFSLDNLAFISLTIGQSDDIFQSARTLSSAGVLTLQSKRPEFKNKPYILATQIKGGSFGLFNPNLFYAQKISSKFSMSLNTNWLRADNRYPYELKNVTQVESGKRANSEASISSTELNLYGNLGKAGNLQWKTNYYYSSRGLPGSVIFYNNYAEEHVWNRDFFTQVHYENAINDKISIQSFLKFTRNHYKYIDINNKYAAGMMEDRITQFEYYGSLGILYSPIKNTSISLSQDLFENRLHSKITDTKNPYRYTSLTALSAQYKTNNLTVTGSLLATFIQENAESGEIPDDKKKITPALSFSYRPLQSTDLRIRGSYKKTFRVPTFTDLYYLRMGNINLRPENATQYNIGATWVNRFSDFFDFFSVSVDGYHNDVKDKIVPFPTLNIWKMRNFGTVRMNGIDVNAKAALKFSNDLSIDISTSYSYQSVIDVTDKNAGNYKDQLPYTPKNYGAGSVSFTNPYVNISYSIIASGKRYSLDQNIKDNELASYTDQSISLNKTFTMNSNSFRVQFDLLNLANKNYQIIQYYPMPGRSFVLSGKYEF